MATKVVSGPTMAAPAPPTMMPDNSGESQGRDRRGRDAKGRWRKGTSGNPSGPPTGSRHRTTRAVEALLDGEGEDLTRKAVAHLAGRGR
jgi:hypothetical protein